MVNNKNPYLDVLKNLPVPPLDTDPDGGDREIGRIPIWSLEDFKGLAAIHSEEEPTLIPVTRKCRRDLTNLVEEGFDLCAHIQMLSPDNYRKSVWCRTGSRWIPCDAYALRAAYTTLSTGYSGTAEYYFKMCKGLNGITVVFISIHQWLCKDKNREIRNEMPRMRRRSVATP